MCDDSEGTFTLHGLPCMHRFSPACMDSPWHAWIHFNLKSFCTCTCMYWYTQVHLIIYQNFTNFGICSDSFTTIQVFTKSWLLFINKLLQIIIKILREIQNILSTTDESKDMVWTSMKQGNRDSVRAEKT